MATIMKEVMGKNEVKEIQDVICGLQPFNYKGKFISYLSADEARIVSKFEKAYHKRLRANLLEGVYTEVYLIDNPDLLKTIDGFGYFDCRPEDVIEALDYKLTERHFEVVVRYMSKTLADLQRTQEEEESLAKEARIKALEAEIKRAKERLKVQEEELATLREEG